jgi:hypothetical protein
VMGERKEGKTREVREAEHAEALDAIAWSIVLRSDRFTKRTVNVRSSRKCSLPNTRVIASNDRQPIWLD